MGTHSRRRFLELAGAGTAVALAGCSNMPAESEGTASTTETKTSTETTTEMNDETTETEDASNDITMSSVFHFSEGDDHQKHAVANVANLLNDDSTDTETIALVANGVGVKLLTTDSTEAKKVKSLAKKGVKFKACHNSMNKLNYAKEDLISGVEVVPAGVGELTKLQAKKEYAYIKTP
jgi:intracellular sulfur oxidation DsrE/DsrF family protein